MSDPHIPKSILVKPGTKKPRKPNPVQFSEYLTLINGTVGTQVPFPDDKHGKKEKKVLRKEGLEPDSLVEGKTKKSKEEPVGNIDIEKIIGKSIYDSDSEDEKPAKNNKSKDSGPSISQILLQTSSDDENKKKKKKKKVKKNLKIGSEAATLVLENVYEILLLKSKFSQNCKFRLFSNGIVDCYENNEGESGYNKYVMSFISKSPSDNSVAEEFSNKTPNLIAHWVCLDCIPSIKSDGEEEPTLDEKFSMLIIFKDSAERSQFNTAIEKHFKSKKSKIKNFRNSSAKNIKSLFSGGSGGKKSVDPFPGVNFHREEDEEPEDDGKSKKPKKSKKKSKKDNKNNEKNESEEEAFNAPIKSTVTVDE